MAKKTNKQGKPERVVRKDSSIEYITDYLINKATHGALDKQTSNFQVTFNKILSETHKKEIYQILEFPTFVPVGHLEILRDKLIEQLPYTIQNDVDLQIVEFDVPNKINLRDSKMTRIANRVNAEYADQKMRIKNTEEAMEKNNAPHNITLDTLLYAKQKLERRKRLKWSFKQVREHTTSGGTYMNSYIFLELTAKTVEELNVASPILKNLLAGGYVVGEEISPYVFEQITVDMYDYIKRFGVASLVPPLKKKDDTMPYLSNTSNLAVVDEQYKPGIIRSSQPKVYIGHLLGSNYMYHACLSGSTDPSNMLIMGKSGSGKTVEAKTMALWMIHDENLGIIINDYKGGEWAGFSKLVSNSIVLNFNINDPTFINTYTIPDYRLLGFTNPRDAYQASFHITTQMLVTLVDPPKEDRSQVELLCSDIVYRVMAERGVDPSKHFTYEYSKNINFADDTWLAVEELTNTAKATDPATHKYEKKHRDMVRNALFRYFNDQGDKRGLFMNELILDDIIKSRLIIVDYGMQSVGGAVMRSNKEYNCWLLQKFFISTIFCGIWKAKHKGSVEYHEEVAQQFSDPVACEYICRDITGNRSNNKTNILLTNSISPLLNPKENASLLEPIRDNINIFMIGKSSLEVARDFIRYTGQMDLYPDVKKVTAQSDPAYKHSFLLYNESGEMKGSVKLRVILPDSMYADGGLMHSRDIDTSGYLSQSD